MTHEERLQELDLILIVSDAELKVRAVELDQDTAQEYYEAMETEEDMKNFPPPTVYFDGYRYWLADGHHRYIAASRRGYQKMTVKVINGSRDDAILAAVKLNLKNGLRFNENDWEKIILLIASKPHWKNWSNRRLGNELGCSEITIRRYRNENSVATGVATEKRQGKDGKMYKAKKSKKPKAKNATTETSATAKADMEKENAASPQPEAETPQAESAQAGDQQTETPQTEDAQTEPTREETPQDKTQEYTIEEAKAADVRVFEIIDFLGQKITEWFDLAPPDLHEDFDNRVRKRLEALIR